MKVYPFVTRTFFVQKDSLFDLLAQYIYIVMYILCILFLVDTSLPSFHALSLDLPSSLYVHFQTYMMYCANCFQHLNAPKSSLHIIYCLVLDHMQYSSWYQQLSVMMTDVLHLHSLMFWFSYLSVQFC